MDSNRRRRLRVLLADDHQILRDGLRSLLEDHPDIEVVADTGEGREAVRLAGELKPDVAIMDIGMPELNGIDATREIVVSGAGTKVVCLSVHREGNLVKAMMDAGASGYLLKTTASRELIGAVRTVAGGGTYLSPSIARDMAERRERRGEGGTGAFAKLTLREREALQLVAEGHDTKTIAERMGVSPKTVLAHRESLMRKLKLDSIVALARYALREGVSEM